MNQTAGDDNDDKPGPAVIIRLNIDGSNMTIIVHDNLTLYLLSMHMDVDYEGSGNLFWVDRDGPMERIHFDGSNRTVCNTHILLTENCGSRITVDQGSCDSKSNKYLNLYLRV